MGNPFVHVELNTTSLPKAKAFYAKLAANEQASTNFVRVVYNSLKQGKTKA